MLTNTYFQLAALFNSQINNERFVREIAERFEGHELVVGLGCPRVHLYVVPQRNHQELDALVPVSINCKHFH